MTRVLVVYHDIDVADIEADELRRAGYEVDQCAGPIGGDPCPVLRGEPCWQAEKADVLVYDTWESGHGDGDLIADLRAVHPDKPIVLTSSGSPHSAVDDARYGTAPVLHAPTRADLKAAVERALAQRPVVVAGEPVTGRPHEPAFHGPRW